MNSLLGIDKLTEKSQVSEDGTMVAVPQTEFPQTPEHRGAAGASDTESISGRDTEVRRDTTLTVSLSVTNLLF